MIGVELVADKETRQHLSAPHFVDIWEMCKDMGVLFGRGGLNANVSIFARMFFAIISNVPSVHFATINIILQLTSSNGTDLAFFVAVWQ